MGTVIDRRALRPADPQAVLVRHAPELERLAYAMQPVELPLAGEQREAKGTAEVQDAGLQEPNIRRADSANELIWLLGLEEHTRLQ